MAIKRKTIFIILAVVLALIALGYLLGGEESLKFDSIIAERMDLIQEVNVTGRVQASDRVELAFEKTGRIAYVYVDVGDTVHAGQILIQLESSDVAAQIAQAEASLKIQQADLQQLILGSREEEIEVQKVKVVNAKVSLGESKRNLVNVIQDGLTKSDDAVRNSIDQFFSNPYGTQPKIDFLIADQQLEITVEQGRMFVETILDSWKISFVGLTEQNVADAYSLTAQENLNTVKSFLDNIALAINDAIPTATVSQTTIDGYKADVSTVRTNVNTAITNLFAAEEKFKNAQSALTLAEHELILKEAGATLEQIAAQEAKVEEAKASVQNYRALFTKTIIRSPIVGVVTIQNAKRGEIVSANITLVSIISESQFEIETNIPEADIAKVYVGDKARTTLDAYGDDVVFEVFVTAINPAETIIDGVATYTTTLQFVIADERVKSGMTANLDIITAQLENVISVPWRAVLTKDGKKIVRIANNGTFLEVEVDTGLRGSDGFIEIINGVNEGDRVITLIRE